MNLLLVLQGLFRRQKYYVLTLSGIAICIFLVYARYHLLVNTKIQLQSTRAVIQTMEDNQRNAVGLEKDLTKIQTIAAALDVRWLDPAKKAKNVAYFYGLENTTQVVFKGIDQQKPTLLLSQDGVDYYKVPYGVSMEGSFRHILDCLYSIDASPHFLKISSLSVIHNQDTSSKKGDGDKVNASMQFYLLGRGSSL